MANEYIYRVAFKEPPIQGDARTDFFFHSLAAIYDTFTDGQIGCKVENLWNIGIDTDRPYSNKRCTISREPISRKKRKSAPTTGANSDIVNLHEKNK